MSKSKPILPRSKIEFTWQCVTNYFTSASLMTKYINCMVLFFKDLLMHCYMLRTIYFDNILCHIMPVCPIRIKSKTKQKKGK